MTADPDLVVERSVQSALEQRNQQAWPIFIASTWPPLKVSKPGIVKVDKLTNVERYSHAMHISSTVTGELLDVLTCWDALQAALPVGTVSVAPEGKS